MMIHLYKGSFVKFGDDALVKTPQIPVKCTVKYNLIKDECSYLERAVLSSEVKKSEFKCKTEQRCSIMMSMFPDVKEKERGSNVTRIEETKLALAVILM